MDQMFKVYMILIKKKSQNKINYQYQKKVKRKKKREYYQKLKTFLQVKEKRRKIEVNNNYE